MAALRFSARALTVVALVTCLAQAGGCGTDAVGVESCRRIELARCDAAAACGIVDDADSCQRFYHDQCLHGLPVTDPPRKAVDDCAELIERARDCAVEGAEGKDTALPDCSPEVSAEPVSASSVCDLVAAPELAIECRFLAPDLEVPEPSVPTAGAGGAPPEPEPVAGSGGTASDDSPTAGSGGAPSEEAPVAGSGGTASDD